MNANEVVMRLKAFEPSTPVWIAVPAGQGGGGPNKLLPIVRMGHHGLLEDHVSDHPQAGLELFTPPWNASASPPGRVVTTSEIIERINMHHDETNIRIAVPMTDYHRILHIETVGFGKEATPDGDVLPVELITEGWESLAPIIRHDTVDMAALLEAAPRT